MRPSSGVSRVTSVVEPRPSRPLESAAERRRRLVLNRLATSAALGADLLCVAVGGLDRARVDASALQVASERAQLRLQSQERAQQSGEDPARAGVVQRETGLVVGKRG